VRAQVKATCERLAREAVEGANPALLQLLSDQAGFSAGGCLLHGIAKDAPAELFCRLLRSGAQADARHPERRTFLIHKVGRPAAALAHASMLPIST
jgi:hypothetical protein